MCEYSPKILITCAKGMMGRTLVSKLSDFELIAADLPKVDITDAKIFDASTIAVADALRRPELAGTFNLTCSGEAT